MELRSLCARIRRVDRTKIAFWAATGLLLYTQVGYGLALAVAERRRHRGHPEPPPPPAAGPAPSVSVIVAAYAEEEVIADRVDNLRALDYPADRVEVIVACDGSPDRTAARAREAGADVVLELPRGGKVRAQDAAVERSESEIVAFSDANASWAADALVKILEPIQERRQKYEANPKLAWDILEAGSAKARTVAEATMVEARDAANLSHEYEPQSAGEGK